MAYSTGAALYSSSRLGLEKGREKAAARELVELVEDARGDVGTRRTLGLESASLDIVYVLVSSRE